MRTQHRRGFILGLMAIGLLAGASVMAGPAQAASGNGPYYAEPSWSQKLPAATRFVVLTDWNSEAVLDRNTGLVWEKTPEATRQTWVAARFSCANRTTGGQKGWRLPSMPELTSLVDPSVSFPGPTLPPGHPFVGFTADYYWSATSAVGNPDAAWDVLFANGRVDTDSMSSDYRVWCVRGGGPLTEY